MSDGVRPCWRVSGAPRYRYHYTQRDAALAMARERVYLVSERPHQRHGTGFFTTTAAPETRDDDQLLRLLFVSQRTVDWIEGVLVLSPETPGKSIGRRLYFAPAEPLQEIDLSEFLIGICVKQGGIWTYSEGVYVSQG